MMRNTTLLALLLMAMGSTAQQLPQFTQYFMNDYAINPATAGIRENIEIRSNNRYQWEGLTDAPRTYTLSLSVPMSDQKLGVGAYLFTDIVGPTRRVGFQLGGAYRLPISEALTLGVGVSVGMLEYSVDGHKIELRDQNDIALINALGRTRVVDAKAGIFLEGDDFYFGFSIPQVAQNNVDLYSTSIAGNSTLKTHMFVTAGYRYEINEDYKIEPNIMVKYVSPTPIKVDISVRGIFRDFLWLGGSYRNNDAFTAMIGVKIQDKILIGYSHDFTTSDIRNYSSGTHEVMLGLDIPKPGID